MYKEDKKLKHNGTIEYTSREAHRGAPPSRRGDFEILAYCLLHWMEGSLPWSASLANPDTVSSAKHAFFEKLPSSLITFFPESSPELKDFFNFVSRLQYETQPDYNAARRIFLVRFFKLAQFPMLSNLYSTYSQVFKNERRRLISRSNCLQKK